MNTSILQENLIKALVRTGRMLSARPPLPVMNNTLLVAEEGEVQIVTTNTETTEKVHVPAKVEKAGKTAVNARLLTELISSLPHETIHLVTQEGNLHVSCVATTATLPCSPAEDFPQAGTTQPKTKANLPKRVLLDALENVLFAAAADESRPVLTGVRMMQQEGALVFAATDGYRLSVRRITTDVSFPFNLLVPCRALSELVKVAIEEKDEESLFLGQTEGGQLNFTIGNTHLFTRRIDGEYPKFEKIIPTTHTTRLLLNTGEMINAIKLAAIFARDSANIVRFHIENQTVVVSANTPQVGEGRTEVEAKVDGEGGDVAFNCRFLLEFLSHYKDEELLFEMAGSLNPGVFKPVRQSAEDSYLHIIMPVRVQS